MKTKLALALAATAALRLAGADAPAAPCCPAPDAKPACCAETKPAAPSCCTPIAPAAPLSARSLYQLDETWTDDAGTTRSLAALRGQPVVVAMFFASCEYACPVIVNDLRRLRAALPAAIRDRARFVLVSFDTARDTPEALRAFRTRMDLDASWTLLRGEADAVAGLAMLLGVKYKQDARGQFAHSNLLTVLNADGEIVHQLAGLNGDVSETARVLAAVTPQPVAQR
jgi:protein SCO1/2